MGLIKRERLYRRARKEKKDRDRKAVRLLLEGVCGGRHR